MNLTKLSNPKSVMKDWKYRLPSKSLFVGDSLFMGRWGKIITPQDVFNINGQFSQNKKYKENFHKCEWHLDLHTAVMCV